MIDLEQSIVEQRTGQGHAVPGMVKTAADIARYETLIAQIGPAWIVELGTYRGVSAVWLAEQADCHVITVDTHPQIDPELHGHRDITWITGNSAAPAIVTLVTSVIRGGGPVMVICDSDHSADHVHAEMVAYASLVTVDSYLCVEDTIVEWIPEQLAVYKNSSPLGAVKRFLAEHSDEWLIDHDLEDMLPTTQSPMGWLKRLK